MSLLGDLYRINPKKGESFEADSQSGGRSSARSDLFHTDASLSGDTSGINLPPVLTAEFLHLDSKPTLCATPSTAVSAFCFGEDEHHAFLLTSDSRTGHGGFRPFPESSGR